MRYVRVVLRRLYFPVLAPSKNEGLNLLDPAVKRDSAVRH